jgi:predicted Zn-dependent protease
VVDVRRLAVAQQKTVTNTQLLVNRNEYLEQINGLIHGENPRQGFVEKDVFYHPELKFQFPIPGGWKLVNLPTQVQMIDANQKGMILFTLAATSSAKEAADKFTSETKAGIASRKDIKINGLKAVKIFSEIKDGSNVLRVESSFIEKTGRVYVFHGFADRGQFDNYQSTFTSTMDGFKNLKDKSKLNVQPDRIRLRKTASSGSLKQILSAFGVTAEEMKEVSLLNGINPEDQVTTNTFIKTIEKGR